MKNHRREYRGKINSSYRNTVCKINKLDNKQDLGFEF